VPSKMGKFLMLNCLYSAVELKTIQVIFIWKNFENEKNGKMSNGKSLQKLSFVFCTNRNICQFTVSLFFLEIEHN